MARTSGVRRFLASAASTTASLAVLALVPNAQGGRFESGETITRGVEIAAEVDARYPGFRVTEASSTAVIDSMILFDYAVEPRVVDTRNGVYYAVCPNRATCPYPGRAARPTTAFVPRQVALELAARTFVETTADLVAVSLPTADFVLMVVERDALDGRAILTTLAGSPGAAPSAALRAVVDAETLPALFAPFALAEDENGGTSLLALAVASRGAADAGTSKPDPTGADLARRVRGRQSTEGERFSSSKTARAWPLPARRESQRSFRLEHGRSG